MRTLIYVLRLCFDFNVFLPMWVIAIKIGDALKSLERSE